MKIALTTILILITWQVNAAKYYCDPSSASGTTNGAFATPWKTIAQVNAGTGTLNPGDTVFFKRGQTYSGSLTITRSGTVGNDIVYTNYGTGSLPTFDNTIQYLITLSNRSYVTIDGIKFIDNTLSSSDPNHTADANTDIVIRLYTSTHITISNCDFSFVGIGVATYSGSDYTIITNNWMHELRMVVNTPTVVNNNDDYGCNPMVLGSSNNTITNNLFETCWGDSYDYGFDGGAVELFGDNVSNNFIAYNTAIDCVGFTEIGSSGTGVAANNIIAYNKIINCSTIGVLQTSGAYTTAVSNLQYYNNTIVETVTQFNGDNDFIWMSGAANTGMIIMKNNIFYSSTLNKIFATNGTKYQTTITHSNNIFRMTNGGSTFGITLNGTELFSTTANLFTSVSGAATTWNYALPLGSAAINFGTSVGYSSDIIGTAIVGNPDAGAYEYLTPTVNSGFIKGKFKIKQ